MFLCKPNKPLAVLYTVITMMGLSACQPASQKETSASMTIADSLPPHLRSVVYALNLGGDTYVGVDGIHYQGDANRISGDAGTSTDILGSQDPALFETYRQGDVRLEIPLDNGTYDITFKFAEPDSNIAVGERVFDVLAEQQVVIADLDIRLARDGNPLSDLVRSVKGVEVIDGKLSIAFAAKKNQPVLHALVVRKQVQDDRDWQLVWSDEFDYQGKPDPQKWRFDLWDARKVNDEDQAYTDRLENARVEDGKLIIEAHKETYKNAEYTSARLHTLGTLDFLYGKVEVRAKVPAGQGTWAAIWMLPSDPFKYASKCSAGTDWQGNGECDAWPNSGEIDIMEHVGYDMQTVHGTVHNKAYYWRNWQQRKASIEGQDVDQDFHVYGLEWTPDYIIVSFDELPYFYYRNDHTGWQSWPFDHPYHLILNLAIGGAWGRAGGPIDDSIFPVNMQVDYVRVYQQKSTSNE